MKYDMKFGMKFLQTPAPTTMRPKEGTDWSFVADVVFCLLEVILSISVG